MEGNSMEERELLEILMKEFRRINRNIGQLLHQVKMLRADLTENALIKMFVDYLREQGHRDIRVIPLDAAGDAPDFLVKTSRGEYLVEIKPYVPMRRAEKNARQLKSRVREGQVPVIAARFMDDPVRELFHREGIKVFLLCNPDEF